MRIYWIDIFKKGKIGIMARPRGNEWLEDEIMLLAHRGIELLVSLLEEDEVYELELEREAHLCKKHGIAFLNFPIKDRSVPANSEAFRVLVKQVDEYLEKDKRLVIHCRMGIGRASLLAAGILVYKGIDSQLVFELISEYRRLTVPDTPDQINWLKRLYKAQ